MQRAALASLIASVLVAASTAGFGTVLLVRGEVVVVSPLMLCMLAGLLVGISLLVVLPQATDSLGAQGWQTESVHVLFLLAPMAMYFIENIMVENIVHCLEEVGTQLRGLKIQCNGFDLSDIASLCPSLKSLIIQKEAPNPGKRDLV